MAKRKVRKKPVHVRSKANSKKTRQTPAAWQKRSDDEWEKWGEHLGKRIEKQFEQFGEEVEWHGKRLEKHGARFEKKAVSWWYRTFGPLAPLAESAIGVICIWIGLIILNFINTLLSSGFLTELSFFIYSHIGVFFAIFLFFNSVKFIYRILPRARLVFKPLEFSAGISVFLWIVGWVLLISGRSSGVSFFGPAAAWIFQSLYQVFLGLIVLSYAAVIIIHYCMNCKSEVRHGKKESQEHKSG